MTDTTNNETKTQEAEAPAVEATEQPTSTAVAETAATAVATTTEMSFEDQMIADAGAGAEFISMNERTIPFLAALQNGSPEVQKGGPNQIKGAESSMLMNTLTKQIFHANVAEPEKGRGLLFLPVQFKTKDIEWHKRDQSGGGGGLVRIWGDDQSYRNNGKFIFDATRNRWANPENNSEISTHYETYGIIVGYFDAEDNLILDPAPAVLSMKGSQVKKSKAWNSELVMRRMSIKGKSYPAPLWYDAWRVQTKYEQNDQGSWFGYVIGRYEPKDMPQPIPGQPKPGTTLALPSGQDLYVMARDMANDIKAGILVTDDSNINAGAGDAPTYSADEVPF